mgnify:CR=1 FL=1
MKDYKWGWICLLILIILSPLGLIAAGTAWGEWGIEELKSILGYVLEGLAKMSDVNHIAFFPDYSLPSGGHNIFNSAAGYYISAVIGVCIISVIILIMGRLVVRKEKFYRK